MQGLDTTTEKVLPSPKLKLRMTDGRSLTWPLRATAAAGRAQEGPAPREMHEAAGGHRTGVPEGGPRLCAPELAVLSTRLNSTFPSLGPRSLREWMWRSARILT
eukprot:scaffold1800_cov237-Pinguiococcus_pyrenoidosus.AAC.1